MPKASLNNWVSAKGELSGAGNKPCVVTPKQMELVSRLDKQTQRSSQNVWFLREAMS